MILQRICKRVLAFMLLCSISITLLSAHNDLASTSDVFGPTTTNLLFVHSYCDKERFNSTLVLPYIEQAVDVDHQLQLGYIYTVRGGSRENSMSHVAPLLKGLLESPPKVAVIHPGCFNSTSTLADTSQFFNSTLVTYAFGDLPSFPHTNHLHMVPKETYLADGVVSLLKFYGWQRIVVFSDDSPVFTSISRALDEKSREAGMKVTNTVLRHEFFQRDEITFPSNNRIVLLNGYPDTARKILCKSLKIKRDVKVPMRYPFYVWITYEWHSSQWWTGRTDGNCTDGEIEDILERSLVVSHHPVTDEEKLNLAVNFTDIYERYAYDAVLALFAATDQSEYEDFEGGVPIVNILNGISFNGSSGLVSFQDGMRRAERVFIKQYKKVSGVLKLVTVASQTVDQEGNFSYFPGESNESVWNHSSVPSDGTPKNITNTPLIPLMSVVYAYTTAGILFAIVCLIFNTIFRHKRLIRLTSPKINYIIILGSIVFYCATYTFFHLPNIKLDLLTIVCNMRLWLTTLGFTLCFGPINAKMWRVYHICRKPNPSMKQLFIKDWHLMLIVAGLLATDLIILIIITSLDSLQYSLRSIPDKEHPELGMDDRGITLVFYVTRCFSATEEYWFPIIIGYKVLLQIIGAFLAFNIRKIKIKGLNDSKEISIILYITTIIIIFVVIGTLVFGDYINVDGAVYGLGVSTATHCVLIFIFVPKMVALYKDPKGETIFNTSAGRHESIAKSQTAILDCKIITLETKIKELEFQLDERKESSFSDTTTTSSAADVTKQPE